MELRASLPFFPHYDVYLTESKYLMCLARFAASNDGKEPWKFDLAFKAARPTDSPRAVEKTLTDRAKYHLFFQNRPS